MVIEIRKKLDAEKAKYKRLILISKIVVLLFLVSLPEMIATLIVVRSIAKAEILAVYALAYLIICIVEYILMCLMKKQKRIIKKYHIDLELL